MNHRPSASMSILLITLIAAYTVIGTLYASFTPAWQVPDEPAHYNYVRSLAEGRGLPILEPGDYDQEYLQRLTSEGFPPELSVEPLEYEDHQPPLYYMLAAPLYRIFRGALLPLRLVSVVLGAGLLIVAFSTVRTMFPRRPTLGLMAAAFIAFIPQHVAMTAGVNNDTLAELVVAGTLWALVVYLGSPKRRPWRVGILLGIAFLTKTTAYVVVGVAAGAVLIRWRREGKTRLWAMEQLAWMLIPGLLISSPWFIRNALTYGWSDPLGLAQHRAIVEGQPRSFEWLMKYGWGGLLSRMTRTTFQSFWGQFGWMALPLPSRIYQALLLFSALLAVGFIVWLIRQRRSRFAAPSAYQSASRLAYRSTSIPVASRCLLLVLSTALTFSAFAWYNLTFVQHQGRYLFPALIPLATAAALGLDAWAQILPTRLRDWATPGLFIALASFDIYCLFRIIVPNL